MGYFDDEKNVKEYIKMTDGYDGRDLIDALKGYLQKESTVLELGMGPGKDLEMLSESFTATGSDSSQVFIELYRNRNQDADLVRLDAITIETERKFDCIYSNKVMHHLTREDMMQSFQRQKQVLNEGGILFHSFWYGSKEEENFGMLFCYYTESELSKMIGDDFEIVEMKKYKEMEEGDSFYVIAKAR